MKEIEKMEEIGRLLPSGLGFFSWFEHEEK